MVILGNILVQFYFTNFEDIFHAELDTTKMYCRWRNLVSSDKDSRTTTSWCQIYYLQAEIWLKTKYFKRHSWGITVAKITDHRNIATLSNFMEVGNFNDDTASNCHRIVFVWKKMKLKSIVFVLVCVGEMFQHYPSMVSMKTWNL